MTEDIYAKPDLTKKVKFQAGGKERNTDACDDIDNATIYDNYLAEEDKSQDKATEDQQQTASVNGSSRKRNLVGGAIVVLGLLLLVAVIILVVLFISERNRLLIDRASLTSERDRLQTSNSEMKSLQHNLTSERDRLQTSNSEMKSLQHNLTQNLSQLGDENDHLKARTHNLTKERDELQKRLNETTCCPENWIRFGNSCYLKSTSRKTWTESKNACETYCAHLLIISSSKEQEFISSLNQRTWIGLTDEESEGDWTWVDGTAPTTTYWRPRQPDNYRNDEHCAEISLEPQLQNWNDLPCSLSWNFICEKTLP